MPLIWEIIRTRVAFRLAIHSALLALGLGLVVAFIQLAIDFSDQEQRLSKSINHILISNKHSATQAARELDSDLARKVALGILTYDFVVSAQLVDDIGNQLVVIHREEIKSSRPIFSFLVEDEISYHSIDLNSEGDEKIIPYGTLTISIDRLHALEEFYDRSIFVLFSGILHNFILVFLLFIIFHKIITKPLMTLGTQINSLSPDSKTNHNLPVPKGHVYDELGLIYSNINDFVEKNSSHLQKYHEQTTELMRYESIVSTTSDSLAFIDTNFVFKAANQTFADSYGMDANAMVGLKVGDVMDKEIFEGSAKENLIKCFAGEEIPISNWYNFKHQGRRYIRGRYIPFQNEEGLITGAVATFHDETEIQIIQEKAMRQALIFDQMSDIVVITNLKGEITDWNPAAEHILGYTHSEIVGKRPEIYLDEDVRSSLSNKINADLLKYGSWVGETNVVRKDGVPLILQSANVPLKSTEGDIVGTLNVSYDVTDSKTHEARLHSAMIQAEAANQAKSEFLANMSHELRTPLNAVLGFSQVMAGEYFGPHSNSKYHEYAEHIENAGSHLLGLINDILDLSKIEAGEGVMDETVFDLLTPISECISMIDQDTRKTAPITLETSSSLPMFKGDQRQIKQIILNLLSNASKFTPIDGTIKLNVALDEHQGFIIKITDDGCGIDEKDIATVLEPFGQVRGSPRITHEGTGLGLPLTKKLVELHGGEIKLASEIDKGTTITLTFPANRTIIPKV